MLENRRPVTQFSPKRLQSKIQSIQTEIPLYLERTHRADLVQPLMMKFESAIKFGKPQEAEKIADEVLRLIKN